MPRTAAVAVQMEVAGEDPGVAADWDVKWVIPNRQRKRGSRLSLAAGIFRDMGMGMIMAVRVAMLGAVIVAQLAPGGDRDPAAKTDQRQPGGNVDQMAKAIGKGDACVPDRERDQQCRKDMSGSRLQRRARGLAL